jgi:hypothetical protein
MQELLVAAALVAAIAINAPASAADDAALRTFELEAYRESCKSLLASTLEATGKRLGAAETLNQVTECAKAAQAKCDALPRTDGFCKALRGDWSH